MRGVGQALSIVATVLILSAGRNATRVCRVDDIFPQKGGGSRRYKVATLPADCTAVDVVAQPTKVEEDDRLGDLGVSALAVALIGNMKVTTIFLDLNGFGVIGAKALSSVLKVNTALKVLSIAGNRIGDEGLIAIAEALANNGIGPEAAYRIGSMLKINRNITELNLRDNAMGAAAGMVMGDVLQVNSALVALDLRSNGIGSP
eukprot:gene26525-11598_t